MERKAEPEASGREMQLLKLPATWRAPDSHMIYIV